MTKPFEVPVNSSRGAPMGRCCNFLPDFVGVKVHLQQVPMVDGDYDKGGAYWGGGSPLFCAWGDNEKLGEQVFTFVRASTREAAKLLIPGARFYR